MLPLIYISTRYPAPIRQEILNSLKFSDAASADVFSNAIFHGLVGNNISFDNINVAPIGHFPQMCHNAYNNASFFYEEGIKVWNVGYSNIYAYQYYSIYKKVYNTLIKNLGGKDACFLIYSIHIPIIKAVLRYKKHCSQGSKIILIIPDLIEDMYNGKGIKSRIQKTLHGDINEIYREMDAFIYLTESMKEKTGSNKPYRIIEGIYDDKNEAYIIPDYNHEELIVFYSGKLHEKFGVKNLVDAFEEIDDDRFRLVICGSGDSEDYIKRMASLDSRIKFYGQVRREDVLKLQSKATLLVNPRTPEGDFTKYSFPSKNIQYLASAIPMLIYQLDGIPSEYYKYCDSIPSDNLDNKTFSSYIKRACLRSSEERRKIGLSARQFILKEKTAVKQCSKMIDLINLW